MKVRISALFFAALLVACSSSSDGGGDEDSSVRDTSTDVAQETDLRIVIAATAAMRSIGDPAAIGILQGAPARHPDGRVRREAKAAALRLRKSGGTSTQAAKLADELETLRTAHAALLQRVEKLEDAGG